MGSGYLDMVVVLHQLPGGAWGGAVGPAFSYREPEHSIDGGERLTDDAWREMLATDSDQERKWNALHRADPLWSYGVSGFLPSGQTERVHELGIDRAGLLVHDLEPVLPRDLQLLENIDHVGVVVDAVFF